MQQTTSLDGNTKYAIVDGQQRVRTVLQFVGAEGDPEQVEYNEFVLDKLPAQSLWRNARFVDLDDETRKRFYGYTFAVRYLNTDNDDEVRDMFRRLNLFLAPLKPQELRNATYTGPFVQLALSLADNEYWVENRMVTPAAIRRMSDVEFVSELVIGLLHGPQGGSAAVIDAYYQQYEDYEDEFPDQKRTERLFHETLSTVQRVVPEIRSTRWSNKTDFYTLFVAVGGLLKTRELDGERIEELRDGVITFALDVDRRLGDEEAKVSSRVVEYVRAVEKGANDKKRRADRQKALMSVLDSFFYARTTGR